MRLQSLLSLLFLALWLPAVTPQQPSSQPAPPFDADTVSEEVQRFYTEYWRAWDQRDADAVAAHLAEDFVALSYAGAQGVVQADRSTAVAGIREFFAAVRDRETLWGRGLLSVVPRSETEALAAVRYDFSLKEAGGEIQLNLDVLRKEPDGHWRLLRQWSEKRVF
jgi:ketosteroid isomerase-like protein